MPMRVECRHYESRTYGSGEVVRKCRLDLAPEAPWRCPDDCPKYDRRQMDVGWQYGSLRTAGEAPKPEPEGSDVARLLDEAEDIVNAAAPEIMADVAKSGSKKRRGLARKNKKRKKK
jgi:hypothetical protein